ncbi:hypothetical protein [Bacillus sp. NEB1478]|uniref:anti-sigma-I factor RsgI family protein n=1 Tax=Bacillus sp. NEB1478 TaxID=3073816 RepID=UPI002873B406|nr:hypothetical protein [Bacillus sp. NEB1478]WNB92907.1 hypothetical protein RGB74_04335 [Bacillus sp. NEB1478]
MKSGIVIEINNKKATLLMKDGTFVTVKIPKGKRPLVGKEYQTSYFSFKKRSLFALPSLSLSVAVLVAFVFLSGIIPIGSQSAAAAYVSFDINPSLEVGVNDEMKVVELSAFNKEAKQLIKKHHLSIDEHPSFQVFANQLINAYEAEGYMKSDHSMLITTVSSEKGNGKTEAELDQAVNSIVKQAVIKYPVAITVTETNRDTRKKAAQLGVSSGKLTAFQKANKQQVPIQEKIIKEANIQDLQKKAAVSSKDIKVIPHPKQMHTPDPDKSNNHTDRPAQQRNHESKEYIVKPNKHNKLHTESKNRNNNSPVREKNYGKPDYKNNNRSQNSNESNNKHQENRKQNYSEQIKTNPDSHHNGRNGNGRSNEQSKNSNGHNGSETGKSRHNH